jgi:hypothetical protein
MVLHRFDGDPLELGLCRDRRGWHRAYQQAALHGVVMKDGGNGSGRAS